MIFDLKYVIFIYIIFIILLYLYKPSILTLGDNKNKKLIYLVFLIIILAIISYYIKVVMEYFF
jgi:hypothetical protein